MYLEISANQPRFKTLVYDRPHDKLHFQQSAYDRIAASRTARDTVTFYAYSGDTAVKLDVPRENEL